MPHYLGHLIKIAYSTYVIDTNHWYLDAFFMNETKTKTIIYILAISVSWLSGTFHILGANINPLLYNTII